MVIIKLNFLLIINVTGSDTQYLLLFFSSYVKYCYLYKSNYKLDYFIKPILDSYPSLLFQLCPCVLILKLRFFR